MSELKDPTLTNILHNMVPFLVQARAELIKGGWAADAAQTLLTAWVTAYIAFQVAEVQAKAAVDSAALAAVAADRPKK